MNFFTKSGALFRNISRSHSKDDPVDKVGERKMDVRMIYPGERHSVWLINPGLTG